MFKTLEFWRRRFKIDGGVKINSVNNDRLKPYENELIGSIILRIDNEIATDVESVSRFLNNKNEQQGISLQMINKNGQLIRIII